MNKPVSSNSDGSPCPDTATRPAPGTPAVPFSRRGSAIIALAIGLASVATAALWLKTTFETDWSPLIIALVCWSALTLTILGTLGHHPYRRFGAANCITTVRAIITVSLMAAIPVAPLLNTASMQGAVWMMTSIALIALLLDGIDGFAARATDHASRFGARYDMEIDAMLVMVLSTLLWKLDVVGPWILAMGLMRYLFVAAGFFIHRLQGELYPSFRRKCVCVVQVGSLCLMMMPTVQGMLASTVGWVALALLAFSFARDTRWLLTQAVEQG